MSALSRIENAASCGAQTDAPVSELVRRVTAALARMWPATDGPRIRVSAMSQAWLIAHEGESGKHAG